MRSSWGHPPQIPTHFPPGQSQNTPPQRGSVPTLRPSVPGNGRTQGGLSLGPLALVPQQLWAQVFPASSLDGRRCPAPRERTGVPALMLAGGWLGCLNLSHWPGEGHSPAGWPPKLGKGFCHSNLNDRGGRGVLFSEREMEVLPAEAGTEAAPTSTPGPASASVRRPAGSHAPAPAASRAGWTERRQAA